MATEAVMLEQLVGLIIVIGIAIILKGGTI